MSENIIYTELEPTITSKNIIIGQLNVDLYVDLNSMEGALNWLNEFQEISKTTMRLTKPFSVKGNKVIFRETRHCIHSHKVKQRIKIVRLKIPKKCIIYRKTLVQRNKINIVFNFS